MVQTPQTAMVDGAHMDLQKKGESKFITQKRLQLELPTENSVYSQENRRRAGNYAHLTSENGK